MTCTGDPLVCDFLSYLEVERGLSQNTVKAYRRDIEAFYLFLKGAAERPEKWPPEKGDVERYATHLHQSPLQVSSQSRKLIAVKVFLRFLFREDYMEKNVSKLIETPKQWQKIPSTLDYEEMHALLKAPDLSDQDGIRDQAMFELLYGTGIRVSELCGLSIYDVSDDSIRVYGKGGKERIVPIGKTVLSVIDRYLHEVRGHYESEKNIALFVTRSGKRITRDLVWRRVHWYAEKLSLTKRVSPHVFRHTYASHLLEGGADIRVIQDLLGHEHISSTDRYTQVSTVQIQERFSSCHPRWEKQKD